MTGVNYSAMAVLQESLHARNIKTAQIKPPLFILGFWRSGTTFLHELMSCDDSFGFPSTCACMNPWSFLLTESYAIKNHGKSYVKRPMDHILISVSSPQEDEFALLAMGARSPYEMLVCPSLAEDVKELLDFDSWSGDEQYAWKDCFRHFIRLLSVQENRTLLMKSPTHGFRLKALTDMFPEARFLLLERNPYDVFSSNVKMWNAMLDLYSYQQFTTAEIENFILEAFVLHEQAIQDGTAGIPEGRFYSIQYEELAENPFGTLRRVYSNLGLDELSAVGAAAMESYLERVSGHVRNERELSPSQIRQVNRAWGGLLEKRNLRTIDSKLQLSD